jgi:REP element-mobilizing transposase RayT
VPFQVPKRSTKHRRTKPRQTELPFRQHGGARKGAGRKPKADRAGVAHRQRSALATRHPAHVTLKLRPGLRPLRRQAERAAILAAFARGKDRFGFRLAHFTIQNDHLHLIAEADDRLALRRGLQGLAIRIARALNKLWSRRGKVFADRYHDRILTSPREVRNALVYVLGNGKHHAAAGRMVRVPQAIDIYSSAPWFDGFRERIVVRGIDTIEPPLAAARSWLLRLGWRRHGLLDIHELPATG